MVDFQWWTDRCRVVLFEMFPVMRWAELMVVWDGNRVLLNDVSLHWHWSALFRSREHQLTCQRSICLHITYLYGRAKYQQLCMILNYIILTHHSKFEFHIHVFQVDNWEKWSVVICFDKWNEKLMHENMQIEWYSNET